MSPLLLGRFLGLCQPQARDDPDVRFAHRADRAGLNQFDDRR